MSYDYWSTSSQAERRKELERDRDARDTFHSRATAQADLEAQGRFKREVGAQVIGSGVPTYPAIPSGPWSEGDPGLPDAAMDQFGDVNEQEPVGSIQEIDASLERLTQITTTDGIDGADLVSSESASQTHGAADSTKSGDTAAVSVVQLPGDAAADKGARSLSSPSSALPQPPSPKPWRRF
jgi:hypothetical protein